MGAAGGESFRCKPTGETAANGLPVAYLKADYRIKCHSDFHQYFQKIDTFFMVLYPIGIPMYFYLRLNKYRDRIRHREHEKVIPDDIGYLSALCEIYERECWWFECSECIRKYLIDSLPIVIFEKHPSSQILWGISVCIFAMCWFQYWGPYISDIDDVNCWVGLITLTFIFILGAYLRFGKLLESLNY